MCLRNSVQVTLVKAVIDVGRTNYSNGGYDWGQVKMGIAWGSKDMHILGVKENKKSKCVDTYKTSNDNTPY